MHEDLEQSSELFAAPVLPDDLLPAIESHIRHHIIQRRVRMAVAASIIAITGIIGIKIGTSSNQLTANTEVQTELKSIHDYLNAHNLEDEMKLYAVIDTY